MQTMKRIIDISEEDFKDLKHFAETGVVGNALGRFVIKRVLDSTPLNECEAEDCISRTELLKDLDERRKNFKDVYGSLGGAASGIYKLVEIKPSVYPKSEAEDCISRVKVIDYLCKHCPDDGECFNDCDEIKYLRNMPSVYPKSDNTAKERYEDLCEYFGEARTILESREEFKKWLERVKWHIKKAEELYEKQSDKPSGKWIPISYDGYADGNPAYDYWECSNCGSEHVGEVDTLTDYCPYCGSRNFVEKQEQENSDGENI